MKAAHRLWQSSEQMLLSGFLLTGIILGAAYAVVVPPHEVPDETTHLVRAYGISRGSCVANKVTLIPTDLLRLRSGSRSLGQTEPAAGSITNRANPRGDIYSCVPYVAPAIALAVARGLQLDAVHTFCLGRFANLTIYLALVGLALRLLPDFQLSLFCLALMPMTLHQAASFSADALTISISFLLTAYCLHLSFQSGGPLRPAQYAVLGLIMVVSSLCKFNLWFALLVLLIPVPRFGRASRRWLSLAGYIALCCMTAAFWQWINRHNFELFEQARITTQAIDVRENTAFLIHEPWMFLRGFARTVIAERSEFLRMFTGVLGPLKVVLPVFVTSGYAVLLGLTVLMASGRAQLRTAQRILLLSIAAASFVSIFMVLWVLETTPPLAAEVLNGQGLISGVQGRYFIPFAFLFLAALGTARVRAGRAAVIGIIVFVIGLNVVALNTVRQAYAAP